MNFISRAIRILDADNEGEWRTIKGSHVMIGEGGEIVKGNKTLKAKLSGQKQNKNTNKENVEKAINNVSVKKSDQTKWPGALTTHPAKLNMSKDESHPTDYDFDDYDSRIKLMEDRMKVDIEDEDAREEFFDDTFNAIEAYSGREYSRIIKSQINGDDDYDAQLIENFIKGSPKYGGSIYRGLTLTKDEADKLKIGDVFDNRGGMSSWTTDTDIEYFDPEWINDDQVIVQLSLSNGTKWGTSIVPYSMQGDMEGEVLVSKNQKCKIKNIEKQGQKYIVTVEEV